MNKDDFIRLMKDEDLTAEQEDFILEEALERERQIKHPTKYEITIQKLMTDKEKEGWSNDEFWGKVDEEMIKEIERISEEENEIAREEQWD